MKNTSIWLDGLNYEPSESLKKDISTDVLIIGAGITGLSTAYHFMNKGINVILIEKNKIGHGITGKTTGKLTFLQELIYSNLYKTYDSDTSRLYLKSQIEAINEVENIIKKNNIKCNFNKIKSYVFTNNKKEATKIKEEKNLLNSFGIDVKTESFLPDGSTFTYGISVDNTAVFHPLEYLIALKKICEQNGIKIYENTKATDIKKEKEGFKCACNEIKITAKQIVLALHYPYFLFPYLLPLKSTIEKSYISAYKVEKNLFFSAITSKKPTESIRYLDKNNDVYKIHLSNSHNLAFKNDDFNNFQELIKSGNNSPEYIWSNSDLITSDKLPFIGEIDTNLYIATGYNTWGMTNGSLAGKIVSDLILQTPNEYQELFNPKRRLNKNSVIKFPITLTSNLKSYVGSKINKNKSWYPESVKFKDNLGIYTDENGKKHVVKNKCPHLGCSLIFNEIEKTWDCPCHGSRFDIDGNCIDGPSNYDIKTN